MCLRRTSGACEICDFVTTQKGYLKKHIDRHMKPATEKSNLPGKKRESNSEEFFNCEHCSFSTKLRISLKKHCSKKHDIAK